MIPLRGIHGVKESCVAKINIDGGITSRDGIPNDLRDCIQWNEVDTKPPFEVKNLTNMLLMRLRSKERFKKPLAVENLRDVAELFQNGDLLAHDGSFEGPVVDFLDGNGRGCSGINDALIVLDWNKQTSVVKDTPKLL
jgi:hypothetical protein